MDLTPTQDFIFRSLHPTARRHIRAIDKLPACVRPITDPKTEKQISALISETMERTGGSVSRVDWAKQQEVCTFNFGGITQGSHDNEYDPLGGISDFKRYFTTNRKMVSSEWIHEPRPQFAKAVDVAGELVKRAVNCVRLGR